MSGSGPEWGAAATAALRDAGTVAWQFGALALLLLAVDHVWLRRLAWPRVRLALHGVVLLKLALPATLAMRCSVVGIVQAATARFGGAASDSSSAPLAGAGSGEVPAALALGLVAVWLVGALVFLLTAARRIRSERRAWIASDRGVPASLRAALAAAAAALKVARLPRLIVSARADSPAVVGGGAPLLVLPPELLEPARASELRHALLHELAHLRRGDLWFAGAAWLLCVAWWFHPLAWWVARRAAALRELCCDETVLAAAREEGAAYRATLRMQARALLAGPAPAAALPFLLGPATVRLRLEALARPRALRPRLERAAGASSALLAAALLLPMGRLERAAAAGAGAASLRAAALATFAESISTQPPPGCLRRQLAVTYLLATAAEQRLPTAP